MITPLGTRVILKRVESKDGLIIIPDRYKEKVQEATVESVGPLVTTLKVGDRVLFGKFATIEVAGVCVIWERDVMAVIS